MSFAPVGMYCQKWDWLNSLKKFDIVDSCDETHMWFKSYIVDEKEREVKDCDGNTIRKIQIALRYNDEEFGQKADFNFPGKKMIGWSSTYDGWRVSTCTSIQPVTSLVTPYVDVGGNMNRMDVKNNCSDKDDVLFLLAD